MSTREGLLTHFFVCTLSSLSLSHPLSHSESYTGVICSIRYILAYPSHTMKMRTFRLAHCVDRAEKKVEAYTTCSNCNTFYGSMKIKFAPSPRILYMRPSPCIQRLNSFSDINFSIYFIFNFIYYHVFPLNKKPALWSPGFLRLIVTPYNGFNFL